LPISCLITMYHITSWTSLSPCFIHADFLWHKSGSDLSSSLQTPEPTCILSLAMRQVSIHSF
jgi:hypothetical protein